MEQGIDFWSGAHSTNGCKQLMSTAKKLQDLWGHRRYVAGVCVAAVLAGILVSYHMSFPPKSRSYEVGVANAQVLVDTQRSQVVGASSAVTPEGGQVLGMLATQANLLADLMVEGPIKADIAHRAGLKPNKLVGVSSAVTVPSASTSGPSSVSVPSGPNVYSLTTQILSDNAGSTTLPIIEINAYAPDRDKAARLASAAVAGLQSFVSSKAADDRIPNADRLSILSLGVSQATTQTNGPSPLMGFVVALGVFLLGCGSILWVLGLIRGWHGTPEREHRSSRGESDGEPGLGDEGELVPYELASRLHSARSQAVRANGGSQRVVLANGLSPERPATGVLQRLVRTSEASQRPASTNGGSGSKGHGGLSPLADPPSSPTEDVSGEDTASSSRQRSQRQWSSRKT
jgi:hypothetical protein